MDLRKKSLEFRKKFNHVNDLGLEKAYTDLCELLGTVYTPTMSRTFSEDKIFELIRQSTKLEVLRSAWIGNANIDLFLPSVRASVDFNGPCRVQGFRGLAIEIDGKVHQNYVKILKDQKKYASLHELGISTISIENQDCKSPVVLDLIKNLKKLKRLDHRAKSRLKRDIYLGTILAHKSVIKEHDLVCCLSILNHLGEL